MITHTDPEALSIYWRQQIDAWEQSPLSQADFCRRHDLVYHRFVYWKQKFEGALRHESKSHRNSGFAVVLPAREMSGELSLTLPNGILVRGVSESNLSTVRKLLELLG